MRYKTLINKKDIKCFKCGEINKFSAVSFNPIEVVCNKCGKEISNKLFTVHYYSENQLEKLKENK